jgi:phage repressor protein C with HTH and peptisase S24 domain
MSSIVYNICDKVNTMETDASKIKRIRKYLGLTQQQFAIKCNVKQQLIAMMESGSRTPTTAFKLGFLKAFGTDFDTQIVDVEAIKDSILSNKQQIPENIVKIPFYTSIKAAAGSGSDIPEYSDKEAMYFDKRWLKTVLGVNENNVSLINTEGDSMLPLINDGDLLMVDISSKEILNNKVFVIFDEGTYRVKRLRQELNGDIYLISDNKQYPPEKVTHSLDIIGRVVWNGSKESV